MPMHSNKSSALYPNPFLAVLVEFVVGKGAFTENDNEETVPGYPFFGK